MKKWMVIIAALALSVGQSAVGMSFEQFAQERDAYLKAQGYKKVYFFAKQTASYMDTYEAVAVFDNNTVKKAIWFEFRKTNPNEITVKSFPRESTRKKEKKTVGRESKVITLGVNEFYKLIHSDNAQSYAREIKESTNNGVTTWYIDTREENSSWKIATSGGYIGNDKRWVQADFGLGSSLKSNRLEEVSTMQEGSDGFLREMFFDVDEKSSSRNITLGKMMFPFGSLVSVDNNFSCVALDRSWLQLYKLEDGAPLRIEVEKVGKDAPTFKITLSSNDKKSVWTAAREWRVIYKKDDLNKYFPKKGGWQSGAFVYNFLCDKLANPKFKENVQAVLKGEPLPHKTIDTSGAYSGFEILKSPTFWAITSLAAVALGAAVVLYKKYGAQEKEETAEERA